jgi:ABC-type sulfate transport system substrate-binding protein
MTTKQDFTEEEWARVKRAPFVAGMAISIADPGGPIEAFKETAATLKVVTEAAENGGHGELVDTAAGEVTAEAKERHSPLKGFHPKSSLEIVDELDAVNKIVTEKATPEEAQAFREWLLQAAKASAEAAKEGGFFGFKAELVSEGEQKMLDRLSEVLTG